MITPNKLQFLFLLLFPASISYAQDLKWMLGTWKETGKKNYLLKTIKIDSVYGNYFSGTREIEVNDRDHPKIITAVSGHLNATGFFMNDGKIVYKKDPPNGKWLGDCDNCPVDNKIILAGDSVFINRRVQGCRKDCNGMSNYYRLLCDYDTSTQRYLVNAFGPSVNSVTDNPCIEKIPEPIAKKEDSIKNAEQIAKRQQQTDDSLKLIIAQKKQQQIDDSLKKAALVVTAQKTPDDKIKVLTERDNLLLESYHIVSPDILIELFDNAQLDGDRVSVYHNNILIVNNKALLKEPITLTIHADAGNRMHEFILVAENLGSIAPNTALMRITADKQVYKLMVRTDLKTNAKIVFYYDGN